MMRRFGSIDLKFPLVMSGLTLLTAVLFVWAAYAQFTSALYDETGQRLRSGGALVASFIANTTPPQRAQTEALVVDSTVRRFLRTGANRREVEALLARRMTAPPDPARIRFQLLGPEGRQLIEKSTQQLSTWPRWAAERIADGTMGRPTLRVSPMFESDGNPVYQIVSAVVALADEATSDTTLGYLVETRAATGRGQDAVRELLGAGTFIVGTPGEGIWTDFESVTAGPPPIPRPDSILIFDASPRGAGVGIAQQVTGTPWLVWLQLPKSDAIAPVNAFIWRITPVASAIALLGALLVWLLSRQITNRLVALTVEVDRMEAGQGQVLAELDEGDEIARLESAFGRMSARVEQQQKLEQQLMQSQKIEAVGRLAGGIAHDFNNVLTVVRNYSELVRAEMPDESEPARDMDEVLRATERAGGLTRQLLAFSRQQVIAPQVLDVNEVVAGSKRMLTRLIPSNIVYETALDRTIARISVDRGQLEQVLMNLTINAVDAMPEGGTLTIRTLMLPVAPPDGNHVAPPAPGTSWSTPQVCIVVRDTGTGMDRETTERIFEPFFTTKPVGKGTGLGLATAHGIVTQSGGRITVRSEPGAGTTFRVNFPAVPGTGGATIEGDLAALREPISGPSSRARAANRPPRGIILLVEDDTSTREVTRRLLERSGFRILEAELATAALAMLGDEQKPVDLVLTDVMMPGMSGVELAARVEERWPMLPVLLMSGYSDAEIRAKGALGRQRSLIEKPFTAAGLLSAVESALRGE